MTIGVSDLYPGSLLLALALGAHGFRKGSLSLDGAVAAAVVGYASLANPLSVWAALLLAFYFTGSRTTKASSVSPCSVSQASKLAFTFVLHSPSSFPLFALQVGAARKARLEVEASDVRSSSRTASHKAASGGRRDAVQVLCNSWTGASAAILWRIAFATSLLMSTSLPASLQSAVQELAPMVPGLPFGDGKAWCAISSAQELRLSRFLVLCAVGHFATCMGDTLASELGILANSKPRLITTFRQVPPGTNGGVTAFGTFVSLAGGLFVGLVCVTSLYFGNASCKALSVAEWAKVVALAGAAGLCGSLFDSLLGATLQRTLYSPSRGKVLLASRLPKAGERKRSDDDGKDDWETVSGIDVLSNSAVNFVTALGTAAAIGYVGTFVL